LVLCLPLAACLKMAPNDAPQAGGGDGGTADGGPSDPAGFSCDPNTAALTASPARRMAKVYIENSVKEFLSSFSSTSQTALLATMQDRFNLIPDDVVPKPGDAYDYSVDDPTVAQQHVDNMVYLGLTLGTAIAANAGYQSEMLAPCGANLSASALAGDACLTKFIQYYGRKAFRRPLTDPEVADFKSGYASATAAGLDGLTVLTARLIAHPYFYYQLDTDGDQLGGTEGADATYRLTRWELLSKITFLFWQAPPTDALYDMTTNTDITQDDKLAALVDQVLADPRAHQGMLDFYGQWYKLDQTQRPGTTGNIEAIKTLVAQDGLGTLPESLRDDMNQEVLDLVSHYTFDTDGKYEDILTSPISFAKTPTLAQIYGVSAWDGTSGNLVSLPAGERSGLLTRAAFVVSSMEYTRPVQKGKLIRTRILCDDIPPPPPTVNIQPLVHMAGESTRDALHQVTSDPACWSCHGTMDPLGDTTENYDPLGRVRQMESVFTDGQGAVSSQASIDTSVTPYLTADSASQVKDGVDLSKQIADSGLAHKCMVRNYFRYVSGRREVDATDGCDLESLRSKLMGAGGSIKQMIKQMILQSSFRQKKVG
jgi:hypothetical protein